MPPSCPQPAWVDWTWTPLTREGRSFQSLPLALINQPVDFQLPLWLLNWHQTTPTGRPFKNRAVSLWRRDPTTCSLPSLSFLSMGDPFRCLFGSILSGSASWFYLSFGWFIRQPGLNSNRPNNLQTTFQHWLNQGPSQIPTIDQHPNFNPGTRSWLQSTDPYYWHGVLIWITVAEPKGLDPWPNSPNIVLWHRKMHPVSKYHRLPGEQHHSW